MFMHFFLLCIRLTVLRSIYLTGHAYVCGQEGKEFGESRKGSYNPLQPNLWTSLFFIVLFIGRVFCVRLPNVMPKVNFKRPLAELYFYIIVLFVCVYF